MLRKNPVAARHWHGRKRTGLLLLSVGIAAGLGSLFLSSCRHTDDVAVLAWVGNDTSSFGLGLPLPGGSQHVSLGSIVLCRTGAGPDPRITRAAFVDNGSAVQVTA